MRYADVHMGCPVEGPFTYTVPEGMELTTGMRVRVDFKGRVLTAFVNLVHDRTPSGFEIKPIIERIDERPVFGERMLECARYMADTYFCSTGEALSMALPSGLRPSKRFKNPFSPGRTGEILLNDEQQSVFDGIAGSIGKGERAHLIFGVTGSGKTEIYMRLAKLIMERGASVIYLVPEISLSSQIFERLYAVFGESLVIYHSGLTANQRLHAWMRFFEGEARIAVGTRSAVFLQCPDLGLVIVDEEHDGSYKEHSTPRYNARRIALFRSRSEGAALVMGSATPSMESLYSAERGLLKLHTLEARFGGASLPSVEIVRIHPSATPQMLSPVLKLHSKRAIDAGKQAIYLLNRRGFAPFVLCDSCGEAVTCPNCSIGMNYHRDGSVRCHWCGLKKRAPERCPSCSSEELVKIGSGTQRVEELVAAEFSGARIFRLDQDSSRKKNASFELVERMNDGQIDILLGTQMVAKGFDFKNVTVVGVLLADIGLNLPDFRASERVFALLMQVAGRCGRGDEPGRVIVQTMNEDHAIFGFLKSHDYRGFYRHELAARRMLDYPPFSRIVRLLIRGRNDGRVADSAESIGRLLRDSLKKKNGAAVTLLGPSEAPLARLGGNHRRHIIMKSRDQEAMRYLVGIAKDFSIPRDVYLEIDMDPYELL